MVEGGIELWDRLAELLAEGLSLAQQVAPAERDLVHRRHRQPRPAERHGARPDVDVDRRDRAVRDERAARDPADAAHRQRASAAYPAARASASTCASARPAETNVADTFGAAVETPPQSAR